MAKRRVWLLVLCVAMWVGMCLCLGQNAMDDARERMNEVAGNAKVKAEEAKHGAAEAMHEAKDNTDSWSEWIYQKFSEYPPVLLLNFLNLLHACLLKSFSFDK